MSQIRPTVPAGPIDQMSGTYSDYTSQDVPALMGYLFHCGAGEDDMAYAAKRLAITLHTRKLEDALTDRLAKQSPGKINALIGAMAREEVTLDAVTSFVKRYFNSQTKPEGRIRNVLSSRRVVNFDGQ